MKNILLTICALAFILPFSSKATADLLHDLEMAIYHNSYNEVVSLLDKGAPLNQKDDAQRYPIHVAADYADGQILKLLIDRGAKVDVQDSFGYTPLHRVVGYVGAINPQTDRTLILLKAGASPNIRDNSGQTPIYWAARGNIENLKLLLAVPSADPNISSKDLWTPLMVASSQFPDPISVNLLVANKADKNLKNDGGYTALDLTNLYLENELKSGHPDPKKVAILKEIIEILK